MDDKGLLVFEGLCNQMFQPGDVAQQQKAAQSIQEIAGHRDFLSKADYIIQNSKNMYALYITASSLTTSLTNMWNNYDNDQKNQIRALIVNFLDNCGTILPDYVVNACSKVIGRITKLMWNDDPSQRDINSQFQQFMSHSPCHIYLGFQIISEIVREMNTVLPNQQRTNHRKTAISFRDVALANIVMTALNTIKDIYMNTIILENETIKFKIYESAVSLLVISLQYDFIGTNSDETAEEISTIQIPSRWDTFIIEPDTINLLFNVYMIGNHTICKSILEVLLCLVSIRRSIFNSPDQRSLYLNAIIDGLTRLLTSTYMLNDESIFNVFGQICGRLKSNFQLLELTHAQSYGQFMSLITNLTIHTFQNWEQYSNSISYLLIFWSRMVSAEKYLSNDEMTRNTEHFLSNSVPVIVKAYIEGKLGTVDHYVEDSDIDPLTNNEILSSEMQQLPTIVRFQYSVTSQFIIDSFDPLFNHYTETTRMINSYIHNNQPEINKLKRDITIMENKLTWLINIISGVITGQCFQEQQIEEKQHEIDAELCKRVFKLLTTINYRLNNYKGEYKVDFRLELSLLTFFDSFKRNFITDQLSLYALSGTTTDSYSTKQQAIQQLYQLMGQGDYMHVINAIMEKLTTNLKYWSENTMILEQSLMLLQSLTNGYSSSRLLLKLQAVDFLLQNHTAETFLFLNQCNKPRLRTIYYNILSHLIILDPSPERLDLFIYPLAQKIKLIAGKTSEDFKNTNLIHEFVNLCRDIRGIIDAPVTRGPYITIFNQFFPALFTIIVNVLSLYWTNPQVNYVLLKLIASFSNNKGNRIDFGSTSPNNIHLFHTASDVIKIFGQNLLNEYFTKGVYPDACFKPLRYLFAVMNNALSGKYIPFGVFTLYKDECLDIAMNTCINIVLQLPFDTLILFPKCARDIYSFLEIIFTNHIDRLAHMSQDDFLHVLSNLSNGIECYNIEIVGKSSICLDQLATYIYINQHTNNEIVTLLQEHITLIGNFWPSVYNTLFTSMLFGERTSQWHLSHCQNRLLASQPADLQEKLKQGFLQLKPSEKNLDAATRDNYSMNCGLFKQEVLDYMLL
ncbi:hypothetical protein WA158_006326 [Blastocystis sp. Blastoise]